MSITATSFSSALSGLVVSGVRTRESAYPHQITTAVLPLSYPRLPTTEQSVVTLGSVAGLQTITIELVVVLESVDRQTNPLNYTEALSLIDELTISLRALARTGGQVDSWTILLDIEEYGTNKFFWTLVARVTGTDT